jgi:hypothetical protein
MAVAQMQTAAEKEESASRPRDRKEINMSLVQFFVSSDLTKL